MSDVSRVQGGKKAPLASLMRTVRALARNTIDVGRHIAENVMRRSSRLSSLYYFFFSREFDLEHQAVLAGKQAVSLMQDGKKTVFGLRRSIHRLEKGLVMRPQRRVFAEDYIGSTVSAFVTLTRSDLLTPDETTWMMDVLRSYFDVVDPTPRVQSARHAFANVESATRPISSAPFPAKLRNLTKIGYQDFDALTRQRCSVRWYQDRPIPDDLLRQAIDTACNAPSACNRQSYTFHVSSSKDTAVALAKCAGGAAGFADNIPCAVVVTGNLAAYSHERDRHIIYIDASLAAMQFLLALETLGLSSCVINWADVPLQETRIRKLINLPLHERVVMLISVGYADPEGEVPFSQKNRHDTKMKKVVTLPPSSPHAMYVPER